MSDILSFIYWALPFALTVGWMILSEEKKIGGEKLRIAVAALIFVGGYAAAFSWSWQREAEITRDREAALRKHGIQALDQLSGMTYKDVVAKLGEPSRWELEIDELDEEDGISDKGQVLVNYESLSLGLIFDGMSGPAKAMYETETKFYWTHDFKTEDKGGDMFLEEIRHRRAKYRIATSSKDRAQGYTVTKAWFYDK